MMDAIMAKVGKHAKHNGLHVDKFIHVHLSLSTPRYLNIPRMNFHELYSALLVS